MYGLYDFQDRISEVHKDMLQIYDVDHESKQKVEQLEKETNDLLDEICKKQGSCNRIRSVDRDFYLIIR